MVAINIFYVRYYTSDGSRLNIGGVETYITNLSILCYDLGYNVRIYQYADSSFEKNIGYAIVYGVIKKSKEIFVDLYKKSQIYNLDCDRVVNIVANDTLIPKWKVPNSIVIQHGIGFDSCYEKKEPLFINFLKKTIKAYSIVKKMNNVDKVVCVDNNFICWYRTQTTFRKIKLIPILNFTEIGPTLIEKSESPIKIVFARRFVEIRGTKLFGPVAKEILDKYPNVEITLAGTGPDEGYLKELLGANSRVHFTHYNSTESISFHCQFNIAVIPTIYSEGTSLSLLEAMSAHCAVICTNVGGMTNIILDNFNGLMISPDKDELFNALSKLIEDASLRDRLSQNAYKTVCVGFSLEKWRNQWKTLLDNRFNDKAASSAQNILG